MTIVQSMGDAILRSIPQKGIYHFDVVIQHMNVNDAVMQNVIAGTVIVKIKDGKISTYEESCSNICSKLGGCVIMPMAKRIAIEKAQEIERFITKIKLCKGSHYESLFQISYFFQKFTINSQK